MTQNTGTVTRRSGGSTGGALGSGSTTGGVRGGGTSLYPSGGGGGAEVFYGGGTIQSSLPQQPPAPMNGAQMFSPDMAGGTPNIQVKPMAPVDLPYWMKGMFSMPGMG